MPDNIAATFCPQMLPKTARVVNSNLLTIAAELAVAVATNSPVFGHEPG
jgi:hypothetical protein